MNKILIFEFSMILYSHVSHYFVDLRTVQRGFCFLKENLHREEQLAGYLYLVCGLQFTDDEKLDMCNGPNPIKARKLLMHLMQKGNDSCREFLERLQACHEVYAEFRQSLQHEVNAGTGG